jgi:hypothetical protein
VGPLPSERIRASAIRMARGDLGTPPGPGLCLTLVRLVIEHALYRGQYRLYAERLPVGTSRRTGDQVGRQREDPWAADFEASAKHLGLAVPYGDRQAGDVIFNYRKPKPYGHVGVLLDRNLVLEAVNPAYRPHSIHLRNGLVLTPTEHFPTTLVARLPEADQEGSPHA